MDELTDDIGFISGSSICEVTDGAALLVDKSIGSLVNIDLTPPSTPTLSGTFTDDFVQLTWTQSFDCN